MHETQKFRCIRIKKSKHASMFVTHTFPTLLIHNNGNRKKGISMQINHCIHTHTHAFIHLQIHWKHTFHSVTCNINSRETIQHVKLLYDFQHQSYKTDYKSFCMWWQGKYLRITAATNVSSLNTKMLASKNEIWIHLKILPCKVQF